MPEGRLAGNVLEWLARAAPLEGFAQDVALLHRERAVKVHVELDARKTRRTSKQPLGRELGILVIVMHEVLATPRERIADGPDLLGHGLLGRRSRRLLETLGTIGRGEVLDERGEAITF